VQLQPELDCCTRQIAPGGTLQLGIWEPLWCGDRPGHPLTAITLLGPTKSFNQGTHISTFLTGFRG
jgi:hypothetical protein